MDRINTRSKNNIMILWIISIIFVISNIFFLNVKSNYNVLVIHIFAITYLSLIYKKFAMSPKKFLYFTTLLFAMMDFSLKVSLNSRFEIYYFYITLFIYILVVIKNVLVKKETKKVMKNIFNRFKEDKYFKFLVIFILYMLISVMFANDKKLAIVRVYNYAISIALMIMVVLENKSKKQFKSTMKFLTYVYAGILILGILEICGFRYGLRTCYTDYPQDLSYAPYLFKIPEVFYYNPNNYAVLLVLGMTACFIGIIFAKEKKEKIILGLIFFVSQVNLIFSMSRTAWISIFLIYLFCLFIAIINKNKFLTKKSLIFIIATFLIFTIFAFLPGMTPFYGKFNATPILRKFNIKYINAPIIPEGKQIGIGHHNSMSERYTLIYDVLKGVFKEKNFLGFGVGNTIDYIKSVGNTHGILSIHSLWLEILGDFGVGILMYFIYICLSMLLQLQKLCNIRNKNINKFPLMMASACFGLAFLVFGPSSVITFIPFWIVLGLSYVVKQIFNNKRDNI